MSNTVRSNWVAMVSTVCVGIAAVWASLYLFGDPNLAKNRESSSSSSVRPADQEPPKKIEPAPPSSSSQATLGHEPPISMPVSPSASVADLQALQQKVSEHERTINALQSQMTELQKVYAKPQAPPIPSEPVRPTENQRQEALQKARALLTAESTNEWTAAQEVVLKDLEVWAAKQESATVPKKVLQDTLQRLRERKVNTVVRQAFKREPTQAVQLLTEALNSPGLSTAQRNYLKETLKRVQPERPKEKSQ